MPPPVAACPGDPGSSEMDAGAGLHEAARLTQVASRLTAFGWRSLNNGYPWFPRAVRLYSSNA